MKASILIVGHPHPAQVEFGADHTAGYDGALQILGENKYAVVVTADRLPITSSAQIKDSFDFLKSVRRLNADTQTILVSSEASPQELQRVINAVGLFKIVSNFETGSLQTAVREALEEYELIKQNQAFLALTTEQNQRLHHLSSLLEDRVKARETFLVEAREKLLHATKRTEALNRALVAIQKSVTRQEMEQHLNDALQVALGLSWTRILFRDQTFLEKMGGHGNPESTIFSAPLFRDTDLLGHIYFARDSSKPFSPDEDDFLLQVGDAVGLAIDRLMALEAIENLKQEWDSTFDAITDPVSLVTSRYEVVRANRAYSAKSQTPVDSIAGKKCYEILFSKKSPCEGCRLGHGFHLGEIVCADGIQVNYAVSSYPVKLHEKGLSYAMFYRDVSEEQRIQRQILESSKMAEIGTIGSSIAHEINNPLGGMIAFLQIIKGEVKPPDKIYADVAEMEQAAIRCKTIVENLLAFTRHSVSPEMQLTRIGDLFKIVGNIMELQTRGLGIEIEKRIDNADIKIKADANMLVQVLVNIMHNSCESLAERMSEGRRTPAPRISLVSRQDATTDSVKIEVIDNGTGIPASQLSRVFTPFYTTKDKTKNPGLGLSVSYQIVKDHGGQMEISSVDGQSTTVAITLPVAKSPTL